MLINFEFGLGILYKRRRPKTGVRFFARFSACGLHRESLGESQNSRKKGTEMLVRGSTPGVAILRPKTKPKRHIGCATFSENTCLLVRIIKKNETEFVFQKGSENDRKKGVKKKLRAGKNGHAVIEVVMQESRCEVP